MRNSRSEEMSDEGERYHSQHRQGQAQARRGCGVDDSPACARCRDRTAGRDRWLRHDLYRPRTFDADVGGDGPNLPGGVERGRNANGPRSRQHAGVYSARPGRRRARHHRPRRAISRGGSWHSTTTVPTSASSWPGEPRPREAGGAEHGRAGDAQLGLYAATCIHGGDVAADPRQRAVGRASSRYRPGSISRPSCSGCRSSSTS